ncbi:hypothetical protein ACIA8B_30325 [Micromonospora chalcea]
MLLPTPRVTDRQKDCPGQCGSHEDVPLPSLVPGLSKPRTTYTGSAGHHGDKDPDLRAAPAQLSSDALGRPDETTWQIYAPAIARWELLIGRPVPAPVQPGQHGKPVLAPPFVEWLMGLPANWVTDPTLDLPRTGALRVLGNGVVPAQAATALRLLLCRHH